MISSSQKTFHKDSLLKQWDARCRNVLRHFGWK